MIFLIQYQNRIIPTTTYFPDLQNQVQNFLVFSDPATILEEAIQNQLTA